MSVSENDAQGSLETDKMLEVHENGDDDALWRPKPRSKGLLYYTLVVLLFVAILEGAMLVAEFVRGFKRGGGDVLSLTSCRDPPIRREWRSLRKEEKQAYIDAIHCLFQEEPVLHDQGSLYDDFVWVHQFAGQAAHQHPSFLPWHRWFINQFERALKDKCGYDEILPYWDWTVDWKDLANSSIWDNENGFGGQDDGDPESSMNESCVSGPFKGLVMINFNLTVHPHCLSRKFHPFESGQAGTLSGELIRPEAMGQLARSPDYGFLRYMIEMQMHNIIHYGVIGDLNTLSSANDPIFWLHHAQLDRLWWKWQQEDPETRTMDYGDTPQQPSTSKIHDNMQYLGLFPDQKISSVMRTDTDLQCYRY